MVKLVVRIYPDNREVVIDTKSGCGREVIRLLGYSSESVVLVYKGKPVLEDTCFNDGDEVEVYVATSGG
jgi:sulfur carrier protein ThiS